MEGKLLLKQMIEDCVVGEPKTITLVVTPTRNDATAGFEGDVTEVEDYDEKEEKEEPVGKLQPKSSTSGMAPAVKKTVSAYQ